MLSLIGMASDDITSVGHVTPETSPADEHIGLKSPPAITHKRVISHDEALEDAGYGQSTSAPVLDEEELPWIALAKWRKGLVLAGYVPDLNK
jgi:hypothetical protein